MLRLAALAGDDIDVELLAAATGSEPSEVLRPGSTPQSAAAIVDPAHLRFRHTSLRDVVARRRLEPERGRDGSPAPCRARCPRHPTRWPAARAVHHLGHRRGRVGDAETLVAEAPPRRGRCRRDRCLRRAGPPARGRAARRRVFDDDARSTLAVAAGEAYIRRGRRHRRAAPCRDRPRPRGRRR